MKKNHDLAFVDWGTSNLRVWIVNEAGGVLRHAASPVGADKLSPDQFYGVIKDILLGMGVELGAQSKFPVVMCGMVGSRQGWVEARYLPVPVHCEKIPEKSVPVETQDLDVYIMPGLCVMDEAAPDVMRGEETQLLGFYRRSPDFSGVFCMPGTHSKWGRINRGIVEVFQTAITGELFSLLSRQSVIRHVIGDKLSFQPDHPAFRQGVLDGYHHPERLMFDLFPVRAGGLLFSRLGMEAAARLSGLLIGGELAAALRTYPADVNIALIVTGKLSSLYMAAFAYIERKYAFFDADELVQDGLKFSAAKIFKTENGHVA